MILLKDSAAEVWAQADDGLSLAAESSLRPNVLILLTLVFLLLLVTGARGRVCSAALVCAVFRIIGPAQAEERCDVALAMALDLSQSTADQRALITSGTAHALRDQGVVRAFSGTRVKVLAFAWADRQVLLADWTPIATSADVAALADQIEQPVPAKIGRGTGLIWAVDYARARLAEVECDRELVDFVTDGKAVSPYYKVQRFDREFQAINVLWVGTDAKDRRMVENDLRFGYGAFLIQVGSYHEVQKAMVRKLVLEIASAASH